MRTGTGNGARKREKNSVSALGPPVEVPITKSFGGPASPVLRGVGITGFAAGLAVDGARVGDADQNVHLRVLERSVR